MKGILACLAVLAALEAPWCVRVAAGEAFTFRDDFAGYPGGSDGGPNWASADVDWEVRDGAMVTRSGGTLVLEKAPFGSRVTIEAGLTVSRKLGEQWKVAGVGIWADSRNFWHLALVEKPDAQGGGHFVELCEMREGTWLSQTSLKQTADSGMNVDWRYDTPYRLRLEMTTDGITGSLSASDGHPPAADMARRAFQFTAPAVKHGKPALRASGFLAKFDDVTVRIDETVAIAPAKKTFPPYSIPAGPKSLIQAKPTGFFRTALVLDGREAPNPKSEIQNPKSCWWLIDPNGSPFYIVGTDHVNYHAHWCEKLGYAPYHRNCVQKYGSEEKWAGSATSRLKDWGFNTLAAGHGESTRYRGLAHIGFLSFGSGFAPKDDLVKPIHWTGFPNVFSPKWRLYCEKQAAQKCAPYRDDPWLIGYFIDNELEWFGKDHTAYGLVNEVWKKPADHTAKLAWRDLLREKHKTLAAFNAAWGADLKPDLSAVPGTAQAGWDALVHVTAPLPAKTDPAKRDCDDFIRLIAEKYFGIAAEAIRKADPNHLVLGTRFAGGCPEVCWEVGGKHCDIVSVNFYGSVDLDKGVAVGFEKVFDERYAKCQRPMMITEWSHPALDSGLPCVHGAGQRFDTQAQRAQAWEIYQRTIFTLPYMVGSDFFMWADEPELGISSTFPEDTNYGLVNVHDEPYPLLVAAAKRLNPQVYDIHARADRQALAPKLAQPEFRYAPRAPWRGEGNLRVPIVVASTHLAPLRDVPVSVKLKDLGLTRPCHVADAEGKPVACQVDSLSDGDELCFAAPQLEPGAARTFFVYPGGSTATPRLAYRQTDGGFEADNGALKLTKSKPTGDLFDSVALSQAGKSVELGLFRPLFHQVVGQDLWVAPEKVEKVAASNGPVRLVLDVTLSRGMGDAATITAVGKDGMFDALKARPHAFRTLYRIIVYPDRPYFLSQLIWVENTDREPWLLQDYFHYPLSRIGGSAEGDEPGTSVPNYYQRLGVWGDEKVGAFYGAAPMRSDDFLVHFWKDPGGGQHPDLRREVKRTLQPGERYADPQPPAILFGALGKKAERPWSALLAQARAASDIHHRVFPSERKPQ